MLKVFYNAVINLYLQQASKYLRLLGDIIDIIVSYQYLCLHSLLLNEINATML